MVLSTKKFYAFLLSAISMYYYEQIDPNLVPRDVPQDEVKTVYDFVIIGGGIAGCVLANRLTEILEWTVLLIEAGGDETPESNVPLLFPDLKKSKLDWNFTTVPQKRACFDTNGVCQIARGKVLGGTSVINTITFGRGSPKDFDYNTRKFKLEGWSSRENLPFYKKLENATGLHLPKSKYRGYKGPLQVAYPPYKSPIQDDFIRAGEELGWVERDYNGPIMENTVAYPQLNVDGPSRQSAAKAYLYPIKGRKNLDIIKHSYVLRILINRKRRATGVEYVREGRKYRVKARKEVLLCAGVFNTPKLLMLSGIGPKEVLEKNKIKIKANLPVGQRLQDQIGVGLFFELNKNVTLTPAIWKTKKAILQYAKNRKGPLTSNGMGAHAFNGKEKSKNPPTISYSFYYRYYNQEVPSEDAGRQIITVYVSLLHSDSRGYVSIRSNDPYDPPIIDPKYLSHDKDYDILRTGIKDVFRFMKTSVMRKFSPKLYTYPQPKCENLNEDKYIDCLMKKYPLIQYRPIGTTTIGSPDIPVTVANSYGLVKKIKKLRIASSSIAPGQATGYPFGAIFLVGEIISNFIKKEYKKPTKSPTNPSSPRSIDNINHFMEKRIEYKNISLLN